MPFAPIKSDLKYWQKQSRSTPLYSDLTWNIPEHKSGRVSLIGGNSQGFSNTIRLAEFMQRELPFFNLTTILPDALRGKLPDLPNIDFANSTSSGSFAKSALLQATFATSDAVLIAGDLSKNSETAVALAGYIDPHSTTPLVITRDSIDLLTPAANNWLERPHTFVVASLLQLQKLFRSIYYPRMILLSQPLLPILETLHKFTLTYPTTLITLHENNIIVAANGQISTTPLIDTEYSPIGLWSGQLAARILALNLYNPTQPYATTTAAILWQGN